MAKLYRIIENDDRTFTVHFDGRVDSIHADKLRDTLRLIPSDANGVTLDFKTTEYVSSIGLRELLILCERLPEGSRVIADNCNELVSSIFEMTGFDAYMEVKRMKPEMDFDKLTIRDMLLFRRSVYGNRPFVVADRTYSNKEVEMYAQIFAADLFMKGVKKGSHVAIFSPNSINWIVAFLAVQKLGGIAMPLSTSYTVEDLVKLSVIGDIEYLCVGDLPIREDFEDFTDKVVNDDNSNIRKVIDIGSALVLDGREEEYEAIREHFNDKQESEDDSCILFTSGSTGNPKAVIHSSYAILHAAKNNGLLTRMTRDERVCINMPLFHTLGLVRGLLLALITGAAVYLPEKTDPESLIAYIEENQCTVMNTVPGALIGMINSPEFSSERVSSLRVSILGGAAVPEATMKEFMAKFPKEHFITSYGMSEISPISATDYSDTLEHITHTVGKPFDEVEVEILDFTTREPLPNGTGVKGEIVVKGREAMTAYYKVNIGKQAFDEEGYILTGDFGFIDEDGYLHICGRMKELIKYKDLTVEPNEVADVMAGFESISDVKVVGVSDKENGQVPVACITLKSGKSFDDDAIRAYLKDHLDEYKIPREFMIFDKLPALANGKVDGVTLKRLAEEKYGTA